MPAHVRQVAKRELALECDYSYEARCQQQFRQLVAADPDFTTNVNVPRVITDLCTPRLLTTELVPGAHIDKVSVIVSVCLSHTGGTCSNIIHVCLSPASTAPHEIFNIQHSLAVPCH